MTIPTTPTEMAPARTAGRSQIYVVDDHAFAREWLTNFNKDEKSYQY
jgi:hypothetical protein